MKTNGTFKTTIAKVGEVEIPALIIGNFAIHYFINIKDDGYSEYVEPGNPALGMKKIERWAVVLDKTILNISHTHSGYLVYHPSLANCKSINKTKWLKMLKQFAIDIEPLADWTSKEPRVTDEIAFLKLKNKLPQGQLVP